MGSLTYSTWLYSNRPYEGIMLTELNIYDYSSYNNLPSFHENYEKIVSS